jgi:hypothetical protein
MCSKNILKLYLMCGKNVLKFYLMCGINVLKSYLIYSKVVFNICESYICCIVKLYSICIKVTLNVY